MQDVTRRLRFPDLHRRSRLSFAAATLGLLVLALVAAGVGAAADGPKFNTDGWLQGADGFIQGIERAKKEGKPLLVYFYADWCGYCRQAEQQILGRPEFRQYLKDGMAVMINPDKGERENGIARYYQVQGYPTFFVWNIPSGKLVKVERFRMVDNKPEILSPDEFIARIKEASKR